MSAQTPSNGKYRRSWTTWGSQMIPSDQYKNNYDKIIWGEETDHVEREELTNPQHYRIRIKASGQ
jgi:hypothetical protein